MPDPIRTTYAAAFPRWSQPFWTFITGKPGTGERAPFVPGSWLYLAVALAFCFAGIAGSLLLATRWTRLAWLMPLSVGATLYGSRLLILTIAHQCAHLRFCAGQRRNRLVHDLLSTVLCSQNFEAYRLDHFHVHHALDAFGTYKDPVLMLIRQLGFTERLTRAQLWRRLAWTCISPYFHSLYLRNRLRSNFLAQRPARRAMAVAWWSGLLALVVLRPELRLALFLAYGLPVLLLYNISAFLELICEHTWMRPLSSQTPRQRSSELIWGRFCGDAVPAGAGALAWLRWGLRMVLYHLPCRLLVLTGDAPQHDFHHVAPTHPRWTASAYARSELIDAGRMEDREVWGLFEAINIVFRDIASAQQHRAEIAYLDVATASTGAER